MFDAQQVAELILKLRRKVVAHQEAIEFAGNEIRRGGLGEDDVQDLLPAERPGVSKHGFLAAIVLRVVDVEGEIVVAPSGKGAGGFANVLLGIVADAHGEQLHELATEILVRAAFQVLPGVEKDQHRRIARDGGKQGPEISGGMLLEQQ